MVFKNLCVIVPWMKEASALEGFTIIYERSYYYNEVDFVKKDTNTV